MSQLIVNRKSEGRALYSPQELNSSSANLSKKPWKRNFYLFLEKVNKLFRKPSVNHTPFRLTRLSHFTPLFHTGFIPILPKNNFLSKQLFEKTTYINLLSFERKQVLRICFCSRKNKSLESYFRKKLFFHPSLPPKFGLNNCGKRL